MRRAILLLISLSAAAADFELAGPGRRPVLLVPAGESGAVRLAAEDLAFDLERITGQRPAVVEEESRCGKPCLVITTRGKDAAPLKGKWEAFTVRAEGADRIVFAGSDERGAMFAVYAFLEEKLGVDPLWFWTGRTPAKRSAIRLPGVELTGTEPSFRFRGWFLNDEDLLTEWKPGGGVRHLEYPYYQRVIAPEVSARVFEAMLRLRMNLVIPASFVDITNPAERRLIEEAARRGLFVTQHHVEPMGVSGFGYQNYFRLQGRSAPFSFVRERGLFEEVWRYSAKKWAGFENVIWQLGLRGIADRPVWVADPSVPSDSAGRGKLISDAMERQWAIVKEYDRRPQPLATTTLWMEGAQLNRDGHLRFPPGVTVVFADNGPGWKWEEDFFRTAREPGRLYGVYQHHQYWNAGPHLAQGVSPELAWRQIKLSRDKGDAHYVMLNVGNIREFVLGLAASAKMLRDFENFDPAAFLDAWTREKYGAAGAKAALAYRTYFAAYEVPADRGTPVLLDGQSIGIAKRLARRLAARAAGVSQVELETPERLAALRKSALGQAERFDAAVRLGEEARKDLAGEASEMIENNLIAQARIMRGLSRTVAALCDGMNGVGAAREAMREVRAAMELASRGKWQGWYYGDRKMNVRELEGMLDELQ